MSLHGADYITIVTAIVTAASAINAVLPNPSSSANVVIRILNYVIQVASLAIGNAKNEKPQDNNAVK